MDPALSTAIPILDQFVSYSCMALLCWLMIESLTSVVGFIARGITAMIISIRRSKPDRWPA